MQDEYRRLVESLPDAIFIQDRGGVVFTTNTAGERLTGWGRSRLLGRPVSDLLTPSSQPQVAAAVRRIADSPEQISCEAEILTAAGARVAVRLFISGCFRDGSLEAVQYLARELNPVQPFAPPVPELDLRQVAKSLPEMVLAYNMERRLVFANPAVETLTGYSVRDLEESQFICWVHPEDQPRMLRLWDRLFEGASYHDQEYRLITKDGRVKWALASWSAVLDDNGRQVGVQGYERDITRRKLAAASLHHSEPGLRGDEARYRELFENSPFPMWEEDCSEVKRCLDSIRKSGHADLRAYLAGHNEAVRGCLSRVRVLDVNRAAREFYGARDKQELLAGLAALFDERALDIFREELCALLEHPPQFRTEFQTRTLRGEERVVDMIVTIVDSPGADWSRVIVSFFDVTDRKRLEQEFVQSQKMESLGRMAGGIAHDFNNLLTVINGYSDFLMTEMDAADPIYDGLNHIKAAGEHCAELTRQLLTFSRRQVIERRPLCLNEMLQDSRSVIQGMLGDDVETTIALDPDLGVIEADRGQIQQVVMNLVVNAREAMPNGGRLLIETQNVRLGPGFHPVNDGGALFARLEIRDTGTGIDEAARPHLFEPFFSTKKSRRGTGLGLATVFGIVTQSGGHIDVRSQPGEGSSFRVYLPQIAPPPQRAETPAAAPPDYTDSGTVLVVDDREDVLSLAVHMIEDLGFEVIPAANGGEALAAAEKHGGPIRLLLTDVIMPGMNGPELAQRLLAAQPGMKVVFMSGYTDQILEQKRVSGPGVGYLQKPFTRARLIEVLRAAMR